MMHLFLAACLVRWIAGIGLSVLNLLHIRRNRGRVPKVFVAWLDKETLGRASTYSLHQGVLSILSSSFSGFFILLFFFGGFLGRYDQWTGTFSSGFATKGVIFFVLLSLGSSLLAVPFSYYGTFVIEQRFGFNKMSKGLWLADLLKSQIIAILLLAATVAGGLFLVRLSPDYWWLLVFALFALLAILLIYISPYVIEPLFFKMTPIEDGPLKEEIHTLAQKAGIRVDKILTMDASRRSRHSNAYFTGLGRVKRIVLFDTLLKEMSNEELLAVLAHEIGHWKKKHVMIRLASTLALGLAACYVVFRLTQWDRLPSLVGLDVGSFHARLSILFLAASVLLFFSNPLSSGWSRRQERQADSYAADLTSARALSSALARLMVNNLGNLHPHPVYAFFYYSHPPAVKRIEALQKLFSSTGHRAESEQR